MKSAMNVKFVALLIVCISLLSRAYVSPLRLNKHHTLSRSPFVLSESPDSPVDDIKRIGEIKALVDGLNRGNIKGEEFSEKVLQKDKVILDMRSAEDMELDTSAIIGMTMAGLVIGGLSDGAFFSGGAPVLPIAGGLSLGGLGYYSIFLASDAELEGATLIARNIFGKSVVVAKRSIAKSYKSTVDGIKNDIETKIENTATYIKNIPSSIQSAINKKVEDTVNDIKAVPANIQGATTKKAKETQEKIQKFPTYVSDLAIKKVEETSNKIEESIEKAKDDTIESIVNFPTSVSNAAVGAVDEVKQSALKKVENVKKSTIGKFETLVQKIIPAEQKVAKETTKPVESKVSEVVPKKIIEDVLPPSSEVSATIGVAVAGKAKVPPAAAEAVDGGLFGFLNKSPAPVIAKKPTIEPTKPPVKPVTAAPVNPVKPVTAAPVRPAASKVAAKSYGGSLYGSLKEKPISAPFATEKNQVAAPAAPGKKAEEKKADSGPFSLFGKPAEKKAEPVPAAAKAAPAAAAKAAPATAAKAAPTPIVTAKPTPAPTPALRLVGVQPSKQVAPGPVTTSAASLSESAVKKINQVSNNNQAAIKQLDELVRSYDSGNLTSENFYKELLKITGGSKSVAFDIFPELIGSLPRGERKSILNRYLQQFL